MSTETIGLTHFDLEQVMQSRPSIKHSLTALSLVMATAGIASLGTASRGQEWSAGTTAGSTPARVSEVTLSRPAAQAAATAFTPAERIARLKVDTDLTWDQIARLFGVSRRAVHQWAVGGRMNSHNAELLARIERVLVTDVPAANASARRSALFAPDPAGATPFERALSLRATAETYASGNALTALEQVSSTR